MRATKLPLAIVAIVVAAALAGLGGCGRQAVRAAEKEFLADQVMVFDDEDEVIALANDTTYGLASYVYTRDLSRAWRMAEALEYGMIGINDINPTSAAVPAVSRSSSS